MRIIENGLVPVYGGDDGNHLINARELHEFLEVGTRFNDWIVRRLEEAGAIEGEDFYSDLSKTPAAGRPPKEYMLTVDIAKEIAMMEGGEKGHQVRRYFIEVEKRYRRLATLDTALIRSIMPAVTEVIQQTVAAAVEGALRARDERDAKLASAVAKAQGELGTLKRTAKHLSRRPLQLVMDTENADELTPTMLIVPKEMRKARGWSQAQTAVFLGISRSYYSQIEEGLTDPPGWLKRRIAALFKGN